MKPHELWDQICEVQINGEAFYVRDFEVSLEVDQNLIQGPMHNAKRVTDRYVTLKLDGEMHKMDGDK